MDLSGKSTIKNVTTGDIAVLNYHPRGWTSANAFRIDGEIMNSKKEVIYKLEGGWNDKISIMNPKPKSEAEVLWVKTPYPEKWEYIYGMSHFVLQLNYFPNFLQRVVAPTDTRRRPDQRALENGDMKKAAVEKTRLEEKQRAVRKFNEVNNIEPKPFYFDEGKDKVDGEPFWYYNSLYFEHDRPK